VCALFAAPCLSICSCTAMRGRPPPPTRGGKDKRGVSRLFAPLVALIVFFPTHTLQEGLRAATPETGGVFAP